MKEKIRNKRNVSLIKSMLLMFFVALIICLSLTILLFSVFGRRVYANVLAGNMRTEAYAIAEETKRLLDGELSADSFRFMLRTTESRVVVLNAQGEQLEFVRGRNDGASQIEHPVGGEDIDFGPPTDGDKSDTFGKNEESIQLCRLLISELEDSAELVKIDQRNGIIVAVPVLNENSRMTAAVFIIRPMDDISSTSSSLILVLTVSSLVGGLIMILPLYFMARWLTDPVKKLTNVAVKLSNGDYSARVEPNGSYEVRALGDAFNTLAENLEETIGALTIERNRLRAILDGLGEGIIGFDHEVRVTRFNSSAATLLGGTDSIAGLPEMKTIEDTAQKVLNSGVGQVISINSRERVIRASFAAITEASGQTVGAVVLLTDITEAERLEQTRKDYVANVSHELRTPLASIRGIADMLNDGLVKNEEDKQRYYGYILKESIRLSKLISDLLELSRLQSGGVALKMQRVELYELIADVADRMTEPAKERGMSIDLTVPEGTYYAVSNPDRVEQVLVTLMDNAVKHGMEDGVITVGMDEDEAKWKLWVENPAELEMKDVDHLFERFYKADTAHTGEGTGLGLAITEEVLALMGESIRVSYENGLIRFTFTVTKKV